MMRPVAGGLLAVWLAVLVGSAGWAATPSPNGAASDRPNNDRPAVTADGDPATITAALAAARADLARISAGGDPSPAGALPEEILERDHLLGRIVESLSRHLDVAERLPEARRRAEAQRAEADQWKAPASPSVRSILVADQMREALDNAHIEAQGAAARKTLLGEEEANAEKAYNAAEVLARQSDERLGRETTPEGRNRQLWLHQLARLRSRAAVEAVSDAQAQTAAAEAEETEQTALSRLIEKQLAEMGTPVRFTQADLDGVLSAIDRQRRALDERRSALALAGQAVRQKLADAQQALDVAHAEPAKSGEAAEQRAARLAELESWLALRRQQSDNHDLAVDLTTVMLEVRNWERVSWQYRWLVINSGDQAKIDDAQSNLGQLMRRLDAWSGYTSRQTTLVAGRIGEFELRQKSVLPAGEAERVGLFLAAYRERARLLNDSQQAIDDLRRTWSVWSQDFAAGRATLSPRALVADWAHAVERTVDAVWNFELLSAEDSLDIDGRHVVARRSVTVGKSLGMVLLLIAGYVFIGWMLRGVRRIAVGRLGLQQGYVKTVLRWVHFVLLTMLFIVALYTVNIPLTVFAFLGGALAIGVGFGTQVLLKNMVSGVMLLVERPLRVGDRIEVGSVVGTVTNISIRSSTVRTSDGIEILVPNSAFIENNVTNWTYSNAKVRRFVNVGVDYEAPPQKVSDLLLAIADLHPDVLDEPAPRVLFEDFGSDSMNFRLQYWIDYGQGADGSRIASDLRFQIAQRFSEAGIAIPFPQRVIHLKTSAQAVLKGAEEEAPI